MPSRIRLSRAKGWRMPPGTVNVARGPGRIWGNPFVVGTHGDAATCVAKFHTLVVGCCIDMTKPPCPPCIDQMNMVLTVQTNLADLTGKDLACWCALDAPCHADVLLELANAPTHAETREPTKR